MQGGPTQRLEMDTVETRQIPGDTDDLLQLPGAGRPSSNADDEAPDLAPSQRDPDDRADLNSTQGLRDRVGEPVIHGEGSQIGNYLGGTGQLPTPSSDRIAMTRSQSRTATSDLVRRGQ